MTITKLSEEDFNELIEIQKNTPTLTFNHKGYQNLKGHLKRDFNETEKKAIQRINEILGKSIVGYSSFQNFCFRTKIGKDEELVLRFQYRYDADLNLNEKKVRVGNARESSFVGVGYITVRELHKGFD